MQVKMCYNGSDFQPIFSSPVMLIYHKCNTTYSTKKTNYKNRFIDSSTYMIILWLYLLVLDSDVYSNLFLLNGFTLNVFTDLFFSADQLKESPQVPLEIFHKMRESEHPVREVGDLTPAVCGGKGAPPFLMRTGTGTTPRVPQVAI